MLIPKKNVMFVLKPEQLSQKNACEGQYSICCFDFIPVRFSFVAKNCSYLLHGVSFSNQLPKAETKIILLLNISMQRELCPSACSMSLELNVQCLKTASTG